jgi:hypothetical protein
MTEKEIDALLEDLLVSKIRYINYYSDFRFVNAIIQLRQQRDDARREVCVYEAVERNRGKMVQTDDIAEERGWQYLYDDKISEEKQ